MERRWDGDMVFLNDWKMEHTAVEPDTPFQLTPRELEVLTFIAQGLTDKEIAFRLRVQRNTVCKHAQSIRDKMGVSSRTKAAMLAVQTGLVDSRASALGLNNPLFPIPFQAHLRPDRPTVS